MLSVIIPALNEIYLQKTIENVLENATGEIEVVTICDGYWPDPPIKDHPSVRILHNTVPRGQRHSINDAARFARGKYMMKLDAHCAVSKGFDEILARDCKYEWTMVPRMYNLDIETWQPKFHKRTDYMFIGWQEGHIRSLYYDKRTGARQPDNEKEIDETMTCMGPGWFMHLDRFWELGGCDENHGHWGQQGAEVALKAWLSGGALMVHKGCWFAHWFRGSYQHTEGPGKGRKGFPYSISKRQTDAAREYSDDLWLNGKWDKQKRDIYWLVKKFNPPTWEGISLDYPTEQKRFELLPPFYKHIHRDKNLVTWKGVEVLKLPNDMMLYQEAISEKKPEVIVEIGTKYGGSALYFQDMMDTLNGFGHVVTIDIKDQVVKKDDRITYLSGSSTDEKIINRVKELTSGKQTMVVIDGNHQRKHVKNELHRYKEIVSPGQLMVVEDCYIDRGLYGPGEARDWFLSSYKGFNQTNRCQKYLCGISMGGWLERAA